VLSAEAEKNERTKNQRAGRTEGNDTRLHSAIGPIPARVQEGKKKSTRAYTLWIGLYANKSVREDSSAKHPRKGPPGIPVGRPDLRGRGVLAWRKPIHPGDEKADLIGARQRWDEKGETHSQGLSSLPIVVRSPTRRKNSRRAGIIREQEQSAAR